MIPSGVLCFSPMQTVNSPPPGASIDYQRLTRIFSHNIYCLYFKPMASHCNSMIYSFNGLAMTAIDWQSVGDWRTNALQAVGRLAGLAGWLAQTAQLGIKSWLARYMLWPTQAIIVPWMAKNGRGKRITHFLLSHMTIFVYSDMRIW